jgi:hypothetical protein
MERFERIIVKDLKQESKSHKDKLMQSHRVKKRLDQIQEASRKLVSFLQALVPKANPSWKGDDDGPFMGAQTLCGCGTTRPSRPPAAPLPP